MKELILSEKYDNIFTYYNDGHTTFREVSPTSVVPVELDLSQCNDFAFDNLVKKQIEYYESLPVFEKMVIFSYTQSAWLNDWIRDGYKIENIEKFPVQDSVNDFFIVHPIYIEESIRWYFNTLQKLILNAPRSDTMITLYRGVKRHRFPKDKYVHNGIVSTTIDKKIIDDFGGTMINISIPPNTPLLIVYAMSSYDFEKEVILPSGSIFCPINVKGDISFVEWCGYQYNNVPHTEPRFNNNMKLAIDFYKKLLQKNYKDIILPKSWRATLDLFRMNKRFVQEYLQYIGYDSIDDYRKKNEPQYSEDEEE